MSGNIIDFKKLILKSRDFPSLDLWKLKDPKSYAVAEAYGILDRHEIQRHMSEPAMQHISYTDVLRDLPKHKDAKSWRRSAPIFYWKCYHEGWFGRPEIADRFPEAFPAYLKSNSHQHFKAPIPETIHEQDLEIKRIRKRIQSRGILFDEKFISSCPDRRLALETMKSEVDAGHLVQLKKDLYVKASISSQDLNQVRRSLVDALKFDLNWQVIPCCQTVAIDHQLKPRALFEIGAEWIRESTSINLDPILQGKQAKLPIRKTTWERFDLHNTREGCLLRALMGVDEVDLPIAVRALTSRLKPAEKREILRLSVSATRTVYRAVRKELS
ncbi:hypothetical protein [Pseudosulfitobacter pseudonitzschiae]|uniref:hypothetical protein n=1 Tax=Pseudosulfitobacter pseudonitzschiae TaxID=1402135 RepID=UPI003B771B12